MSRKQNPIQEYSLGNISVYIKENLPDFVDLEKVLSFIESNLPSDFYKNVDMIYIGRFPFLKEREVDAVFQDGAIYLSSKQTSEKDFISDLVHEIAHSSIHDLGLFEDGKIEREFLGKRTKLFELLTSRGYKLNKSDFLNTEYDKDFDNLLYSEIGYPTLENLASGLFCSVYGATSLQEYYANAFENYFVNDLTLVKKTSPVIYQKLTNLLQF